MAPALEKGNLVVLEPTSPVRAIEKMAAWLADSRLLTKKVGLRVSIGSSYPVL